MKSLLTPRNVSTLQSFQPGTLQALEKVELAGIHANTSKDGKVTWLYHGPSLEVISTQTRDRLASWQFGAILKDVGTFITSVKELSYEGSIKLLVGLYNSTGQGMVCLLDVATSQVIKAIDLPHKVSCVEPVLSYGGDSLPEWAISEHLRNFYGIVAVGTQGGYVYLIDMNLDDYDETSDEVSPSSLQFVTPRCRNVKEAREQAMSRGQHLCMALDETSHSKGEFSFRRPDDSMVKVFKIDSVSITCLKYIPQDGNLAVGFNFGGFQLWKLYAPVLEYTSRLEAEPAAVSHFLYQEPENDPKNFCYIWVARDNSVINVGQEGISTVCLYQLSYGKKTWYASYGVFYEELHSVCLRIEHNLAADPYSSSTRSTWMSQIVACYTLKDPVYSAPALLHDNESFEESTHGPDLSLCVFVWEVQDNTSGDKSLFYLGVFDMNRWYHAQMPTSIRVRESTMDLCSYFAVHQLSELCDLANPDGLLHVEVKADSLKRYINNSPLTPEQHFYPSALAFDAVCIFETGTIAASFHGRQRQVLYDMEVKGPVCLLQPQDLYNICLCAGLLPRDLTAHTTSQAQQRQSLLNMALDHSMIKFINSCIASWAAGEFVQQGCTLKFLLDWAWDRVASTKRNIDNVCTPLYDWSGNLVDHRLLQVLHRSKVTLHHLRSIMLTLLTQSAPTTEQGVLELETRLNVIHYLSQHLQLVLWFIDAGLLPESDEAGDDMEGLFRYPAGNLIQAFNSRRSELHKLHSEIQPTDLLLIDGLVECCGDSITSLWEREGGSGLYPPPSLHALLNMYLLEEVSIGVKHSIVFYLLLDLASLVEEDKHEQYADKIAKFAKSFSLPLSVVKQIQAFWLLDHKDFEEAFIHLLHPMATMQLGGWQQCRIIKSLLYQGESKMALRYINLRSVSIPSQEDIKLKLTVLLANGLITEAFEYQRSCRDRNNMADLLHHLFLGCQQTRTVDQLLQMPLSEPEERHLEDYLLESSEPHSAELLVMHYLQRARYIEAIRLNEKIKHRVMENAYKSPKEDVYSIDLKPLQTETSAKARERAAARNSIVDGFFHTLPAPQRKLVGENPSMPRKASGRKIDVRRPKPLSTVVTQSERSKVISHSSLILAMMEKVQEVKEEDEDDDQSQVEKEKDLGPFLCTPITPRKKMRLSEAQDVVYPSTKPTDSAVERLGLSAFQVTRDPAVLNSPLSVSRSLQMSQDIARSKRKARYSTADTMSLLQTPKVRRKSPSRSLLPTALRTPQSILKVRRLITKSPSPASSTLDLSDKTPTTSRPKRLGFTEKLTAKLQQSESQPTTPKLSFAATTPVPSGSRSAPGSVTSTPKHLRFVEPANDDDKTPVKKSPPSPGSPPSPRSVRNRSPTPESLSPKMAARMDNLLRPAIRAERQRGADEVVEPPPQEDEDFAFNFNPSESDEMEVDDEAPTPTDLSPAVKDAKFDVAASYVDQMSDSVPNNDEVPGVEAEPQAEEEDVVDLTEDDDMEESDVHVNIRERADSTQGVVPEVQDPIDREVTDDGETNVTSTQAEEEFLPDSSGEIEIRSSPARSTRSSPARSLRDSPVRSLRSSRESPSRSMRASPSRSSRESPARSLRESPARTLRESPARTSRESPERTSRESPSRSSRESPARSSRESPARSLRASPARSLRESPARSLRESPARTSRESPARTLRESPIRALSESPARSLKEPQPGTSKESAEPSLAEVETKPESARPATPRKDSPTRRREQSWLKMESPVKVFDELFGESPGKSTRSVTKRIVEDVTVTTVTQVTVSTSRRTSRETGQLSPSRRSKKLEGDEKHGSPQRAQSTSPRRTSKQRSKASPSRSKSKKDASPERAVAEPEQVSPERPKSASPSRRTTLASKASPSGRKSRRGDDVSPERTVSSSPGRRTSKSATKASPARRKSKKEDTVDQFSPERAGSASPNRRASKSAAKASPARRKSKKEDTVDQSSPERAGSASPNRRASKSAAKASPAKRKSKKEDTVDQSSPERAGSASPNRRASKSAAKASPARRKSKKEDTVDQSSPERAASPSPSRRTSKSVAKSSPARRKSKKDDITNASPVRASSSSPSRRASPVKPSPSRRKTKKDEVDVSTVREGSASPARTSSRAAAQKSPARGRRKGGKDETLLDSSPERVSSTSPARRTSRSKSDLSPATQSKSVSQDDNEKSPAAPQPSSSRRSSRRQTGITKSPGRSTGSRTKQTEISPERIEEEPSVSPTTSTQSQPSPGHRSARQSPGRGKNKRQMTKLKEIEVKEDVMKPLSISTDLSDSEVSSVSPIRRSPRLMIKTLAKQQTDSEDEGDVVQIETTSSSRTTTRRTASQRKQSKKTEFKTPPPPARVSVPLTPPESGKDSPEKSETEEIKSRRKSPGRKSTAVGRHSTRTRTKDVAMETQERVVDQSAAAALGDTSSSSFQFSEPMSLEPELQARLGEPGIPIKSFIFSPPISRKRSAPTAVVREDPPTPVTSLLPPTPSEETAGPSQKPKTRKAVKKETTKKKKITEPPPCSPSDSPINFVSPAPERRRTRAMDRGTSVAESSTAASTSAVATRKMKTRKKVARLY